MTMQDHRLDAATHVKSLLVRGAAPLLLVLSMVTCTTTPRPAGTLLDAVKRNDVEQVRRLVQWMDPQDRRRDGWHALQLAAAKGYVPIVGMLIDAGVPVNPSRRMSTPLHYAACRGHVEVMRCLLDRGARLDARDRFDKTPLHWAAECGALEAVRLLLDAGADPTARSRYGTPADAAKANRHDAVYDLLVRHGATE